MQFVKMEPMSSSPQDVTHEEHLVEIVQQAKQTLLEMMDVLCETLYVMTATPQDKEDIPESKCLLHDAAITRMLASDALGKAKEVRRQIGC